MIVMCCQVCHDDFVLLSGLSLKECKSSLLKAGGNFDLAVTDCVATRQAVVKQLLETEPNVTKRQVVQVSVVYAISCVLQQTTGKAGQSRVH